VFAQDVRCARGFLRQIDFSLAWLTKLNFPYPWRTGTGTIFSCKKNKW